MIKANNRKKSVKLSIDSTDNQKTIVEVEVDGKKDKLVKETNVWTSQVLLPSVEELLVRNKLSLADLTEICVKIGPGSFTGIRVGLSVANMLGRLLNIRVNGKKNHAILPVYD